MQSPEPPTSAVAQKENEVRTEQLDMSGRNGASEGQGRCCGNKRGGQRARNAEKIETEKQRKGETEAGRQRYLR